VSSKEATVKKPSRRPSAAVTTAAPPDRLSGIPRVAHDEDERQSAQDRDYGQTIFTRGTVPLPRFLRGKKK
jgi:hypothetical protein